MNDGLVVARSGGPPEVVPEAALEGDRPSYAHPASADGEHEPSSNTDNDFLAQYPDIKRKEFEYFRYWTFRIAYIAIGKHSDMLLSSTEHFALALLRSLSPIREGKLAHDLIVSWRKGAAKLDVGAALAEVCPEKVERWRRREDRLDSEKSMKAGAAGPVRTRQSGQGGGSCWKRHPGRPRKDAAPQADHAATTAEDDKEHDDGG